MTVTFTACVLQTWTLTPLNSRHMHMAGFAFSTHTDRQKCQNASSKGSQHFLIHTDYHHQWRGNCFSINSPSCDINPASLCTVGKSITEALFSISWYYPQTCCSFLSQTPRLTSSFCPQIHYWRTTAFCKHLVLIGHSSHYITSVLDRPQEPTSTAALLPQVHTTISAFGFSVRRTYGNVNGSDSQPLWCHNV